MLPQNKIDFLGQGGYYALAKNPIPILIFFAKIV